MNVYVVTIYIVALFVQGPIKGIPLEMQQNRAIQFDTEAPNFSLLDTHETTHTLSDYRGKYVVLEWLNFRCTEVDQLYRSGKLPKLQSHYASKDVVWFSIASGGQGKEGALSSKQLERQRVKRGGMQAALLQDVNGAVSLQYGVETVPHFFLVNPEGEIIYSGALDDAPYPLFPEQGPINYLSRALEQASEGESIEFDTTEAYGCPMKSGR